MMQINNITCTFSVGCSVSHDILKNKLVNFILKPPYNAMILRQRAPPSTALVFESGRVVVLGTKSVDDAKCAARQVARRIQRAGHSAVRFRQFEIANLALSFRTGFRLNFDLLHHKLDGIPLKYEFEPEMFPALVIRLDGKEISYNRKGKRKKGPCAALFANGNVIVTGYKSVVEAQVRHSIILAIAERIKKNEV